MSKTKKIDIKQIATLMNLELSEDELKQFGQEMPETLKAIDNLNELSTDKVFPTYQTTGTVNRFMEEKLNERGLTRSQVFQNSQNSKHGCFVIKGLKYAK